MKRLIILILLLLTLCGCCVTQETWPQLEYQHSGYTFDTYNRAIYLKDGYVLNQGHSYDEVETEDGYDIILHFVKQDYNKRS